jgi:CPA2 family monovalent cation:H+ antiporter-2
LIALKGLILMGLARGFRLPARVGVEMAMLLGPGGEFGFVMIGAALAGGLVDRSLATTLVSTVAISMVTIPAFAWLGRRIGSPSRPRAGGPPEETPPESDERRVIIVGYGRVGALIGDMLDMHRIPFIAIDSDARLVARARSAGKPVYYGDASRPDYMRRSGVETARAVVVTMDSPRANEAVVAATRGLRQDVTLVARARDADHARALYGLGVTDAVPETIEASLQLSEAVLVDIGVPMGFVIASVHEKREEYRKFLLAAGAPERPRSTRKPGRA